jgi:hypothetical protein
MIFLPPAIDSRRGQAFPATTVDVAAIRSEETEN